MTIVTRIPSLYTPSRYQIQGELETNTRPTVMSAVEGPCHGPAGRVIPATHATFVFPGLGV